MTNKPFKGNIYGWRKVACDVHGWDTPAFGSEGYYYIFGFKHETLRKLGTAHNTSRVINHNKETNEIETLNSIYKLIGDESNGS